MAISVARLGSRLPVRSKNGTPAHRQLESSSRIATYVSVFESRRNPFLLEIAGDLGPLDRAGRVLGTHHVLEDILRAATAAGPEAP